MSARLSLQSGDSCSAEGAFVHRYALCSCSDYTAGGSLRVDAFSESPDEGFFEAGDVGVNGDFNAGASVSIGGTLRLSGEVASAQNPSMLALAGTEKASAPPCECPSTRDPTFMGLLAQAQQDNDNANILLDVRALDGIDEERALGLPCGRYFLSRIASSSPLRIEITGRVSLFVETNIELDSSLEIAVQAGARLELFVGGDVRVTGEVKLGDSTRGHRSLRVHIAGAGSLNLTGTATIAGVLDAPHAELVTGDLLTVYGSLLVRRAAPDANLTVHYASDLTSEQACSAPL